MSTSALHAQALQLVLSNHGNACYMNALIQVMVWLVTIAELALSTTASRRGRFYLSVLHNSKRGPIDIMYDPRWHSMIEGWAEVHRQHDVCEFFTFLMTQCDCSLFSGSWQARCLLQLGTCVSLTRGSVPSPSYCTFLNIGQI